MNLIRKNKLLLLCLLLFLFSNIFFQSKFLFNWDAGQLALGTENYSLSIHQPQAPGYFSFVYLAKFFNLFTNDINLAFILINIIVALLTIVFLYKLILILSNKEKTAFIITSLFVLNPLFWFHHLVALTYSFEALIAVLLSYLTVRQIKGQGQYNLVWSAFLVAIIIGFRPSTLIISLPFLLLQFYYAKNRLRDFSLALLFFIFALLTWLPFFIFKVGGLENLFNLVMAQALVAKNTNVYNLNQHLFLLQTIFYALHLSLILIIFNLKKVFGFLKVNSLLFIPLIIIYQLLVYFFLHFGEAGYLLSIVPLFYLLIIPVFIEEKKKKIMMIVFFFLALSQIYFFLFGFKLVDSHKIEQLSYLQIRNHDNRISAWLDFVRLQKPEETLIVVLRGQYLNPEKKVSSYPYDDIRLLSYYLPGYRLHDLLGLNNLYFISENYHYYQHNDNRIDVSSNTKQAIFLADYIHPEMLPQELNLQAKKDEVSSDNIYLADFVVDSFEYNGIVFKKAGF